MLASVRCILTKLENFFQARNLSGRNFPPSHLEAPKANLNSYLITSGSGNFPLEYCFKLSCISEWLFLKTSASVKLWLFSFQDLLSSHRMSCCQFWLFWSSSRTHGTGENGAKGKQLARSFFIREFQFLVANVFHFFVKGSFHLCQVAEASKGFSEMSSS